jgi:hypothetical protein
MEIQLFDGDRLLFRAYPEEPLWNLLREGDLDADRLRADVEDTLRRLRPRAVGDGGYQYRDIDVLGERVRVDVRSPANRELIRASDLHAALRDTAGPLRGVAVAKLEPRLHRLAMLLKASDDGVPAAQLQDRLRERIEELAGMIDSDEVRAGLRREAELAADPRAVFGLVSELRDEGLAEEGDDGIVRPTDKLRLIAL